MMDITLEEARAVLRQTPLTPERVATLIVEKRVREVPGGTFTGLYVGVSKALIFIDPNELWEEQVRIALTELHVRREKGYHRQLSAEAKAYIKTVGRE